jgi:hypothetical protein
MISARLSLSPGKEPDMIRTKALVAGLAAVVFLESGASLAAEPEAPPPVEAPPPIDWRDFIDTDMKGDHVVGEELCALPGAGGSLPDSFAII